MHDPAFLELLVDHKWQAIFVLGAVVWIAVTRWHKHKTSHVRFPKTSAAAEVIIFPLTVFALGGLVRALMLGTALAQYVPQVLLATEALIYISCACAIAHLIERFLTKEVDGISAPPLPALQRTGLYGGAILVAITLFRLANGHSITGLFVSTGAAAAIVAFAMQKTLGDLFSGVALSIEQPFRIGDWLELSDGSSGQVIDLNWRATRLRGWDNSTMVIPNGSLATQGFKNLHDRNHLYAPWYDVYLPDTVDPRFAKALLLEAVLRCDKVLKHPPPTARLADASTKPYKYLVWVHYSSYPAMFAGREEVFREIHYALKQVGLQVAAPTHEIRTRKADIVKAETPSTLLALKGLDIAGWLTDEELEEIAAMSQHQTFDADSIILQEGEVAPAFYLLASGVVEGSISLPNRASKTIARLSPGEYFGITSMVTSDPSTLRFTALTDVNLMTVDLDCLRTIVGRRPELATAVAEVVKRRLDRAEEAKRNHLGSRSNVSFRQVLSSIEKSLLGRRSR